MEKINFSNLNLDRPEIFEDYLWVLTLKNKVSEEDEDKLLNLSMDILGLNNSYITLYSDRRKCLLPINDDKTIENISDDNIIRIVMLMKMISDAEIFSDPKVIPGYKYRLINIFSAPVLSLISKKIGFGRFRDELLEEYNNLIKKFEGRRLGKVGNIVQEICRILQDHKGFESGYSSDSMGNGYFAIDYFGRKYAVKISEFKTQDIDLSDAVKNAKYQI